MEKLSPSQLELALATQELRKALSKEIRVKMEVEKARQRVRRAREEERADYIELMELSAMV